MGRRTPAPGRKRVREERRSVLDYLSRRLGSFQKQLAPEDRDRVGLHMEQVPQLEGRAKRFDEPLFST